jgi:hypothetical protein
MVSTWQVPPQSHPPAPPHLQGLDEPAHEQDEPFNLVGLVCEFI